MLLAHLKTYVCARVLGSSTAFWHVTLDIQNYIDVFPKGSAKVVPWLQRSPNASRAYISERKMLHSQERRASGYSNCIAQNSTF